MSEIEKSTEIYLIHQKGALKEIKKV